jgi:hypothetical protein
MEFVVEIYSAELSLYVLISDPTKYKNILIGFNMGRNRLLFRIFAEQLKNGLKETDTLASI